MRPKVTIVGSINMDLLTSTDQFPSQGETIRGTDFQTAPGGKGANQAVAAARLGADVQMIGCVGADSFGEELKGHLKNESVDTTHIQTIEHEPSGLANIILSEKDNRIIIIPGANGYVTPEYVEARKDAILSSDYVVIQFEIPKQTIEYCIDLCHQHDIPLIINPAPAMELDTSYWEKATYITPNDTEASQLFSDEMHHLNEKLIITMGAEGVQFSENLEEKMVSSHEVEVVDTTGAGDTFNGALAVALSQKGDLKEAIAFANAAAALSITKLGAQQGMPTKKEVFELLKETKDKKD